MGMNKTMKERCEELEISVTRKIQLPYHLYDHSAGGKNKSIYRDQISERVNFLYELQRPKSSYPNNKPISLLVPYTFSFSYKQGASDMAKQSALVKRLAEIEAEDVLDSLVSDYTLFHDECPTFEQYITSEEWSGVKQFDAATLRESRWKYYRWEEQCYRFADWIGTENLKALIEETERL